MVFDRVADDAEFSRIVRSYCVRLAASEIRLAVCGPLFGSACSALPVRLWTCCCRRLKTRASRQIFLSVQLRIPPSKVCLALADVSCGG